MIDVHKLAKKKLINLHIHHHNICVISNRFVLRSRICFEPKGEESKVIGSLDEIVETFSQTPVAKSQKLSGLDVNRWR